MKKLLIGIAAGAVALLSASPSLAWPHWNSGRPTGSSGGTSTGGATSVPEPTDALLLLMGAAGVVIGRQLHARKKKD